MRALLSAPIFKNERCKNIPIHKNIQKNNHTSYFTDMAV